MVRVLYSKNNKGQIVTTDFILAIIILIFILQLSFSLWNNEIESFRLKEKRTDMEKTALSIVDLLIRSPGIPEDWENGDMAEITLGLVKEDHVLDIGKVSKLFSSSIDNTKKLLGIENYDFFFVIKFTNGEVIEEYGTPAIDAREVIVARRLVLYNNTETYLNFGLWI